MTGAPAARSPRAGSGRASADGVPRALWNVVGVDFCIFGLVFPILPLYAHHLGLSVAAIGAVIAAYSLAQLGSAPAWGLLSDRRGRRPAILVATFGTALSCALLAIARGPLLIVLAVVLNGASGGSAAVAQAAVADRIAPGQEGRAFGRIGATIAIGFVLGPLLASLGALIDLRTPFVLAALLAGANLLYAWARFPETRVPGSSPRRSGRAGHLLVRESAPGTRTILIAFSLTTAAFAAFETTFSLVGQRHFGFGAAGAGLAFAFVGVTMALVQGRGVDPLLTRLGATQVALFATVLLAAGLVLVGTVNGFVLLAVGLLLVASGEGLCYALFSASVARAAPHEHRGALLGRQQALTSAARIVGPAVAGLMLAGAGVLGVYLLAAAAALGALVLVRGSEVRALIASVGPRRIAQS